MNGYDLDAMIADGIDLWDWMLADKNETDRFERYRTPYPAVTQEPIPQSVDLMREGEPDHDDPDADMPALP